MLTFFFLFAHVLDTALVRVSPRVAQRVARRAFPRGLPEPRRREPHWETYDVRRFRPTGCSTCCIRSSGSRTSSSTWSPFFEAYKAIKPFLITYGNQPSREWKQSQAERERFDDTTRWILCAGCTTACPVYWTDGSYFGPAAIVNAHRFIFDSRDQGADERLETLNDREGVWRCRTTFDCTEACPRGIEITKAIAEVKRALLFRRV